MDPQDPFDPAHFATPADWTPSPSASRPNSKPCRRRRGKNSADEYLSMACWRWLAVAARLSGKALHVAVLLWHLRNLARSPTVRWRPSKARDFGVSRYATRRGLDALEDARLITVDRGVGRSPIITIIDFDRTGNIGERDGQPQLSDGRQYGKEAMR
jgi:hypothetical protein